MNQTICMSKPSRPDMLIQGSTESEAAAVQAHIAHLQQQAEAGNVVLAGRTRTTDANTFGLVILQVQSEPEARRLMESDPAITGKVMTATLFPYQIAVLSEAIHG